MVVGMLINETEFTVVVSDIMLYTMPLEKEYNWSALNTSDVIVSVDCLALSNPVAVMSLTFAKADMFVFVAEIFPAVRLFTVDDPETFIFEVLIFPATRPSTVHNAPTFSVPLKVVLALDTTIPEFFKYRASVWAIVDPPPDVTFM
jgi:hypothetical protein